MAKLCPPLLVVLFLLLGDHTSSAQQADTDQVKAAIDALNAALSSLDMTKMDALWVHDASVMLINPRDKTISIGWDAVRKNWDQVPGNYSELKVTQAEGPNIRVQGNIAWSTGVANVVGKLKSGATLNAPTFATDVFEKRDGKWLIVSHVALRVPQ
jgi:ketosteroid isomerase-like protein